MTANETTDHADDAAAAADAEHERVAADLLAAIETPARRRIAYSDEQACILQGESLSLLRELSDGAADLVLTDPPYSSGGQFRGDRQLTTREKYAAADARHTLDDFPGDNRDQRAFMTWATLWLTEAWRVLKPGRVCAVFTDWRQLPTMTDALQAGGFIWRGIGTWSKPTGRPNPGIATGQTEFVVWGTKGPVDLGEHEGEPWTCYLPSVLEAAAPHTSKRVHLTEKPLGLMERLVSIAPPGGVVVDPFLGGGTTLAAARGMGRLGLGIELTRHYADESAARLSALTIPMTARDARQATGVQESML